MPRRWGSDDVVARTWDCQTVEKKEQEEIEILPRRSSRDA